MTTQTLNPEHIKSGVHLKEGTHDHGHGHGHGGQLEPGIFEEQHIHPEPTSFIKKYIFSVDHKVIAKQFLYFGLFWGVIRCLS